MTWYGLATDMSSVDGISTCSPWDRNDAEFSCDRMAPLGDHENFIRSGLSAYSGAGMPPQYEWDSLI